MEKTKSRGGLEMSDSALDRSTILKQIETILVVQEKVSEYVHNRLCLKCEAPTDDTWEDRRKEAFKRVRGLIDKYAFSKQLPRNDLGIMAQSIVSYLLNIQHTFLRVLVMIDMIHDEAFNEIFRDSMTTISSKVHEMMIELKNMVNQRIDNLEESHKTLETLIRLEREIDEDNIVICRQISVATQGDSDFVCYMMRKIVAELEHISDYAKECAEIVAEI
jgi:predicted ribosome quality control (RQC) complex YloA/Tae2 family protein